MSEQGRTPEEIQAEIDQTRRDLGETVAAVAEKTDVKAQARKRLDEVKRQVADKRIELTAKAKEQTPESASGGAQQVATLVRENPTRAAIGGAAVVGFLFGRLTARR